MQIVSGADTAQKSIDEVLGSKDFLKCLLTKSGGLVKTSMGAASKEDILLAKQKSESTKQKQDSVNQRIFDLITRMGQLINKEQEININKFGHIIELNDELLENIDLSLDKIRQNKSKESKIVIEQNTQAFQQKQKQQQKSDKVQDIYFSECIDNSLLPFVPKINKKHNAILPLEDIIVNAQTEGVNFFKEMQNLEGYSFPHPYQQEIEQLQYNPSQMATEVVKVSEVEVISAENFLYVDTEEKLYSLLEDLKKASEIGIDLEHHNTRTFQGITCLIQISTKAKDYVIDPFPLWQQLHILNEVFTDPKKVKILHGADMDILWLQRDFGLYIVNMFDTGQAARQLNLSGFSLAFLLKHYCAVEADKKYQLADWRQRPLSKEMMFYARSDTHYLFKIYECLRNDLINVAIIKNINPEQQLISVLKKSGEICLQKYQKPILKDDNYIQIINRHKTQFHKQKLKILEDLLAWRFEQARIHDESLRYILANDVLFQIVHQLPSTVNELFLKFRNLSKFVKENAQEIIDIICSAYGEKSKEQKTQEIKVNKQNSLSILQAQMRLQQKQKMEEENSQNNSFVSNDFEKMHIDHLEVKVSTLQFNQCTSLITEQPVDLQCRKENERQIKHQIIENIKNSFCYEDPLELYCEMYPALKVIYNGIKEKEQAQVNQLLTEEAKQPENFNQENQLLEPSRIDFIEIPEIPQPQPQKKEEVDIRFPSSIGEHYDVDLKRKRKYKFDMKDPHNLEGSKKQQTQNAFSAFQDNEEDAMEEEEEEEQEQQGNEKAKNQQKKQDDNNNNGNGDNKIQSNLIKNKKLASDSEDDSDDDDLEDQKFLKEIETTIRMNEIADKVKSTLSSKDGGRFMNLEDPIDKFYREQQGNGKGKKKKQQNQGNKNNTQRNKSQQGKGKNNNNRNQRFYKKH